MTGRTHLHEPVPVLRLRVKAVLLVLLYLHAGPAAVRGCILLLNGWEPLSLGERVALAPVVAAGYVRRTFAEERTEIDTFSAEISLLEIYKGADLVKNLTGASFLWFFHILLWKAPKIIFSAGASTFNQNASQPIPFSPSVVPKRC